LLPDRFSLAGCVVPVAVSPAVPFYSRHPRGREGRVPSPRIVPWLTTVWPCVPSERCEPAK